MGVLSPLLPPPQHCHADLGEKAARPCSLEPAAAASDQGGRREPSPRDHGRERDCDLRPQDRDAEGRRPMRRGPRAGFPQLSTAAGCRLGPHTCLLWARPAHCPRMSGSLPGLSPLEARSTPPPQGDNQSVSRHRRCLLGAELPC